MSFSSFKPFIFTILFLGCFSLAFAQSQKEIDETYRDANSYFYFEDYEEALALYLKIYNALPNNSNLDYRIGICYLNISGSKHRAQEYLARAAVNTTKRYNEQSVRETKAPLDAVFYLGNAYFVTNQLAKAEETYDKFFSSIRNEASYNMAYFKHQVNSLKTSRVLQRYPINFIRENLGEPINDRFSNFNPVVSGNGKVLAYTTKRRFQNVVFIAQKQGKGWGKPQNITLDLMVDGNVNTLSLSFNGDRLYLFRDDNHDGNIYVSKFEDSKWTPIQRLNENINTPYYETHASESPDGNTLYFTSNRPNGFGDLDIYVSEKNSLGDWGSPQNLGASINTRFNENSPFLNSSGDLLFFSSEGHNTVGGYDIYFSQIQGDGKWSKPINVGYPLNTTDDEVFFQPIDDGSVGLMAIYDTEGFGETDLHKFDIFLPRYNKSIVTSVDLAAHKTDVFPKTIVIDTINYSGVAVFDKANSKLLEYIETNKLVKLFFAGNSYDMRDQGKAAKSLAISLPVKKETEKFEMPSQGLVATEQLAAKEARVKTEKRNPIFGESALVETDSLLQSKVLLASNLDSVSRLQMEKDIANLSRIVVKLSSSELKSLLSNELNRNWKVSASLALRHASAIVKLADSLGNYVEFLDAFSKVADVVTQQSFGAQPRQVRQISTANNDDEFFYKFQQMKKRASSELGFLLDQVIISNQDVNSFSALWDYLKKKKFAEISPYLPELLELLSFYSIENYHALPQHKKEELEKYIETPAVSMKNIIGLSSIFIILLIAIFFLRKYLKRYKK
jgi:hypothetical protein